MRAFKEYLTFETSKQAISISIHNHGGWIRLGKYGFVVTTEPPLFSERHGYIKVLRIFGVGFKFTKQAARKKI